MTTLILNIGLFQAGWLACVIGAARGLPLLGPAAAAAIVGWYALRAGRPARVLMLAAAAIALGAAFDSTLAALGWIRFAPPADESWLAPWWMLALWALFSTTLNVSLAWLHERPAVAAALGAVSGPLAYWAGQGLGALELRAPSAALAALALGWAALLPALLLLARRLDGAPR